MNPKVDEYILKTKNWQQEFQKLRDIVLNCGLTEELKWGVPCYTHQNVNVLLVHPFKEYCAINFLKGVLLADSENILVQQTEHVQSARQLRFTSLDQIIKQESTIKNYIFEALEIEKAGLKVILKIESEPTPPEFELQLEKIPKLKEAFYALTLGRQRAYLLFFNGAKQSKTRETRIEKYIPLILKGIGFNDCTCGLSKKMPSCDGSHKFLKTMV
jgi:uncharacterized protein YdeI (YjbR/CyaY-like superfamily)